MTDSLRKFKNKIYLNNHLTLLLTTCKCDSLIGEKITLTDSPKRLELEGKLSNQLRRFFKIISAQAREGIH